MVVPPAAQAHTPDGAKAFVRFFLATASGAFVSGRGDALRSLALSPCGACEAIAKDAERQHATGPFPVRARYVFRSANVQPSETQDHFVIDVLGTESSVPLTDRSGATVGTSRAAPSWTRAWVTWTPNGWKMARFAAVVR